MMWMMEKDFSMTKLFIGFSISRVTSKIWPNINYIWFCSTGTTLLILAISKIIPLAEFIEGDVSKFIRTCKVALVERKMLWS